MTNDFLTAFHGASLAQPAPLVALVEQVMNAEVQGLERVTKGYANEVYRALLLEQPPVYVRIRRHGTITFADEAWAMEACRRAGVPVPKVHAVTVLEGEEPLEVMVLAALPGRPLGDVWHDLPETSRREVMRRVATALRAMHDITLDGWGRRKAGGTWEYASWAARAEAAVRDRGADMPALCEVGFSEAETDAFMTIVRQMLDLEPSLPVLCHGNLGLDHLFVNDALELTGIIDFGLSQGGPKELDLAMLNMYHPDVPLAWLEHEAMTIDRDTLQRMTIEKVNVATTFLAFDVRRGNLDYLPLAQEGLQDTLRAWQQLA